MVEVAQVTDLIRRAQSGDRVAAEELLDTTYADLRSIARARLAGGGRDAFLDTTSLVNEWYIRFSRVNDVQIESRTHFMRYAATVMRSVIVDCVRRRLAERRGGGVVHLDLTTGVEPFALGGEQEIVGVHDALEQLASLDARMAQVVEMRYFGGMSEAEIAQSLSVSERTVRRDWTKARLWLADALK